MSDPKYRPLPPPSPLSLGPSRFADLPPAWVIRVALAIRSGLLKIVEAITPPELAIFEKTTASGYAAMFGALSRLGVPDTLGDHTMTAEALAAEVGANPDALFRTLRALSANGIFTMDAEGRFANNAVSSALRSGSVSRMREWAIYWSSPSNQTAWGAFEDTLRTGKDGFTLAHGKNVWAWFEAHPDEREMFAHCMMGITVASAPVVAELYPWKEVSTVCDVGGGRGTLLSELLLRHPHLRATLAEGEGVLASARTLLGERNVLDRVTLTPSSFFESVPSGSDAYLLKNILHDWGDAQSVAILKNVRAAMAPGAKLVVVEGLLPKLARDRLGPVSDLQMMVACEDGRERSLAEYHALFEASGFAPGRVFPYPTTSVFEAVAR